MQLCTYAGLQISKSQLGKYKSMLTFSVRRRPINVLNSCIFPSLSSCCLSLSYCRLCIHSWLTEIVRIIHSFNVIEWATGRGSTRLYCLINKEQPPDIPNILSLNCIFIYLHACILAYLHTSILGHLPTCILACLHTSIYVNLNTFILAYLHT